MLIAGVREAPLSNDDIAVLRLIGEAPADVDAPVAAAPGPLSAASRMNEREPAPISAIAEASSSGLRPSSKRLRLDEGIIDLTDNSRPTCGQATSKYNNILFTF